MFGSSSKPVVISYGSMRPKRRRLPAWLLWLLAGVVAGAGGLWYVQEKHLPPRLSAQASGELRAAFDQADAERRSLRTQLDATTQRLDAAQATQKRQETELAAPRAEAQRLRDELSALIDALPADPRGGAVQLRAGALALQAGRLAYDVVLTREAAAAPLSGVMQVSVLGLTARGAESTVALEPVKLSPLGRHALLRGSLALPEGFRPRQATVQVLDAPGGRALGMRVWVVR
jgi:hypothetical protein